MSRTTRKAYVNNRNDGQVLRIYTDKDARNRKASHYCLNHGGCEWCLRNRMHSTQVQRDRYSDTINSDQ
jgi:TusA-related sulfurtransferase